MSRQDTGKTSTASVLTMMLIIFSVPILFIAFLAIISGWGIAVAPLLLGWFGVIIGKTVLEWFCINHYVDRKYANDAEYKNWRRGGGDPYIDAQGFPFNYDDVEMKVRTVNLVYPPDPSCPRCGGAWDHWQGRQCSYCFTYWNEENQQYMYMMRWDGKKYVLWEPEDIGNMQPRQ